MKMKLQKKMNMTNIDQQQQLIQNNKMTPPQHSELKTHQQTVTRLVLMQLSR